MKKPMWILELKIVRIGDKEEDDERIVSKEQMKNSMWKLEVQN